MNVSLYIIGTELTRGIITDKHTPLLTSELTKLGYNIKRSVIVPDDGSIEESLRMGASDSDVLVITGGLGPTSDDMTRNIIASLANVPLEKNKGAWETLYKRVGERIYGANEVQVMIPQGFEIIENPNGTAPGFRGSFDCNSKHVTLIAMPGPPAEMQPMFYNFVQPFLAKNIGYAEFEREEYSVYLTAEAKLEEICQKCKVDGVYWGTRFQAFRISLYITGATKEKRDLFVAALRAEIGKNLIVDGDDVDFVKTLTDYLKENKLTISCAESCTSGLIAKMLTDQSGSSSWFWGGCATYNSEAKVKLLGVSSSTIEKFSAVSSQCAKEMAEGMLRVSDSDVALSITGYAGPNGGTAENPVGTIYIGLASKHRETQVVRLNMFVHSRDSGRRRFASAALILTSLYLQNNNIVDIASSWLYI